MIERLFFYSVSASDKNSYVDTKIGSRDSHPGNISNVQFAIHESEFVVRQRTQSHTKRAFISILCTILGVGGATYAALVDFDLFMLCFQTKIASLMSKLWLFHFTRIDRAHALANIWRFPELIGTATIRIDHRTHVRARARVNELTDCECNFILEMLLISHRLVLLLCYWNIPSMTLWWFIYSLHSEHQARRLNVWGSAHFSIYKFTTENPCRSEPVDRPA